MKSLKVGGSPSPYNSPWHLAIENKEFLKEEINIIWKDFYSGSGEIIKALRNGEIDIAIVATEVAVKDIISGNETHIVQNFVESPSSLGIYTNYDSPIKSVSDLENKKFAISHTCSSSHLKALLNANQQGWELSDLDYEIADNLKGAEKALDEKRADYFLWNKFDVEKYLEEQKLKKIADYEGSWPSFVIVVRNPILKFDYADLRKLFSVLNETTSSFKEIPGIENKIATKYNLKVEKVQQWLNETQWSQTQICESELDTIQQRLLELRLISMRIETSCFCYNL
ncbi:PhnD/SsuA/transferrin family substrate-binding protein [Zunongwangia sp.]|uniref:PhnD/SsuA/transferrin family substrate-binding protein n=1 Tax=Zunongwangia sp. TaxID=1965325 RepID=UPI003AA8BF17